MRNEDVAHVFDRIADLLELKGENVFQIRAYQRAARAIEQSPVPVEQLAQEGRLNEVPGVGKAISEKITELVRTGNLAYYERLAAEFPPGLITLLDVPGVGPKTALLVSEMLGVSTIEELEAAAQDGRLAALPRMGEKAAQNILKSIRSAHRKETRIPLGKALAVAEDVMSLLRARTGVQQITVAGSMRRMRDTIGDLDLIAVAEDADAVIEAFTKLPAVNQVLGAGGKKSSVLVSGDFQLDLRVAAPDQWGSMLQYFTGSREHNVLLRERARRMGLSLNEWGITRLADDALETYATEEAFYKRLGLPWIPPELREGGDEIEMALAGRLPRLVELADVKGDLHVHSDWSDGEMSLEAMVQDAVARGYQYMALTDHSMGRGIARGLSIERLREQRTVIEALRAKYPSIVILHGSEVDVRSDGALDYPDEVLSWLDFVIASVHTAMQQGREQMTARIVRAMENPYVTCIGHLTTRLIGERPPIDVDEEAIFQAAARTGTALEVNSSPNRMDLKDIHAQRARDVGAPLIVSTDAHNTRNMDFMRLGVGIARRAWCSAEDVVNVRPWDRFRAFLDSKRGLVAKQS
jgi:DNA polymerase (family 10)